MDRIGRVRNIALAASSLLALALLAGRLSGLVRELALAGRFGVSRQADLVVVLLTLPDLFVNLLLSGGLSAALVPMLRTLDGDEAARLFWQACIWALIAFGGIGLIVFLWPAAIVALFAPGLSSSGYLVAQPAALLIGLSIPITALSGVTTAYLNADDRYFVAGLGTFIFNMTILAVMAWWWREIDAVVISAAIAAGAFLRLASQATIVPTRTWRVSAVRAPALPLDPRFRRAFAAGVLAAGLALAPPIFLRATASLLAPGSVAAFNYAQKLVELPLGILVTTISTIALTRLSYHHAKGDVTAARDTLYANLRLSLALALLVAVFGTALAREVVALVFQRGAIDAASAERIAALTRIAMLGVPFVSISSMATAALNAQLRTPAVLGATAVAMATLALLATPGLLLANEQLLMGAMVGSQGTLALLLAKRANICFWGPDGVADRRLLAATAASTAIALLALAVIFRLTLINGVAVVGLGAAGFAIAMAVAAKILSK